MGIFSSKTTIKVASTVYNMAGDAADRTSFLKSSLFAAVMNPNNPYLGEAIVTNYLVGPGVGQRRFFRWARDNSFAGLPSLSIGSSYNVDSATVSAEIPVPGSPVGLETKIQSTYIEDGDFSVFAEQYVLANNPDLIDTAWAADYDLALHEITIQYEGGATNTLAAGDYDPDAKYIIANFYQSVPSTVHPLILGSVIPDIIDPLLLPDNTGFTSNSNVNTGVVTHTLITDVTVLKEYSNGDPDIGPDTDIGVSTDFDFNGSEEDLSRTIFQGGNGSSISTTTVETFHKINELREIYTDTTIDVVVNDLGGGDTETVTTTTVGDHLRPVWWYRIDTQDTIEQQTTGGSQIFIYKLGSGNANLDALEQVVPVSGIPAFFPFIPIRINNVSITHPIYANIDDTGEPDPVNTPPYGNGLYPEMKRGYKKSGSSQTFDDLIDEIEANPDLGEIDYAYMAFGVPLNVIDQSSRRYVYQFFKEMMTFQNTTGTDITNLITSIFQFNAGKVALANWKTAQSNPMDPLFGTAIPTLISVPAPKTTTIKIQTTDPRTQSFDNRITWSNITEEVFSGLGKVGAKKNEVWTEEASPLTWVEELGLFGSPHDEAESTIRTKTNTLDVIHIFHQVSLTSYTRLSIYGLVHNNFIYGGKSVRITAAEGLVDLDNSGFLIPMHYPTLRAMNMVDATQIATENTYLIFNSYQIFKKKWYETFLGRLFIIVLLVVLAAVIAPAAIGGLSGVFGTNAAVGAGLGLSGTGAVVAGAVANAIAAVVISTIISEVSVELFGAKWGAIIGAIVSFAFAFGMGGGFNNFNFGSIMNAQTILGLTGSLANGYAGWTTANIAEMQAEMAGNKEEYEATVRELEEKLRELQGNNDLSFNPISLTDSVRGNDSSSGSGSYLPETLDEFIHRTTMNGSDIVDMTLSMVNNYASLSQALPKN